MPRRRIALTLAWLGAAACSRPAVDGERARELFTRVTLPTANGLSGLGADASGALWTIAERDARAYRVVLDAQLQPSVETFAIEGVPSAFDLEGITVLDDTRVAFGTEANHTGGATVLLAERTGAALRVTSSIEIPMRTLGAELAANHGAEGVCGAGSTIITALETTGRDAGRRWAPLARIFDGEVVRIHRLWLTSNTGKIAALDCTIDADGTARVTAIERHFEVTRILTFSVPPTETGAKDITPAIALDLGPTLRGALNLEGLARLPDGRLVAIVDNQWKKITGPNELLVFRP